MYMNMQIQLALRQDKSLCIAKDRNEVGKMISSPIFLFEADYSTCDEFLGKILYFPIPVLPGRWNHCIVNSTRQKWKRQKEKG